MVAQDTARTATRADECVAADASLVRAFDLLGKRWTGVLLGTLSGGPVGFRALARAVPGISDSVLSDRLGELTEAGLVARTVAEGPPVSVTYTLTEAGARCYRPWSRSGGGRSVTSPLAASEARPPLRCDRHVAGELGLGDQRQPRKARARAATRTDGSGRSRGPQLAHVVIEVSDAAWSSDPLRLPDDTQRAV